jgi:hypothetical protein
MRCFYAIHAGVVVVGGGAGFACFARFTRVCFIKKYRSLYHCDRTNVDSLIKKYRSTLWKVTRLRVRERAGERSFCIVQFQRYPLGYRGALASHNAGEEP